MAEPLLRSPVRPPRRPERGKLLAAVLALGGEALARVAAFLLPLRR